MPDPITMGSVKLSTWGTHHEGGNGMAHYMDVNLFGGNVGHAAIELTIPADKDGEALVEKYCMKGLTAVIPFERITQNVLDEHGKVKQQDVYKIYFSWWPRDNGFNLHSNMNSDNTHERSGVDVGEIDQRFTTGPNALNKREQRTYKGALGSRKVNLADKETAHLSGLNRDEKRLLEMERNLQQVSDNVEALSLLEKKLKEKSEIQVRGSLLTLLNNQVPDWKTVVADPNLLKAEDVLHLQVKIDERRRDLKEEFDICTTKRDDAQEIVDSAYTQALETEVNQIRTALSLLPQPEQQLMIQQRDPRFSRQAWVNYELSEIEKIVKPAQSVRTFCEQDFATRKDFILDVLFDKKYPKNFKDKDNIEKWRQFLPVEHLNITKAEMTPEIYQAMKLRARDAMNQNIDKYEKLLKEKKLVSKTPNFQYADHEKFVTRGLAPNHQVKMPLSGMKDGEHKQLGLNAERMLKKMRELTEDGKKFDLATKNCSVTTGAILASGAEPELKGYFKKKAWGGFGNPQEVLNGASEYQHCIQKNKGQKTFLEKLSSWNPLNIVSYVGGKMLNKIASPDTPKAAKFGLGVLLIPVGILAAGVETLKAVLNPKKTFNSCKDFVKYAWSNNSYFLKFCSLPAIGLAAAFAIPAAVQHGIGKAIDAITAEPPARPEVAPMVDRAKLPKDKIKEIDEPDAELAITKITNMLRDEPNSIPVLSERTILTVNAFLKTLDPSKPADVVKLDAYDKAIKGVYNRVNELSQPPRVPERFDEEPLALNNPDNERQRAPLNAFESHRRQSVTVHVPLDTRPESNTNNPTPPDSGTKRNTL